jgi:hypothetical protein
MNVFPAIVILPVREDVFGLEATEYLTVPLPVPELPAVIVTQSRALMTDHAQPLCVVTLTLSEPASPPYEALDDPMV